jgi:phosphatidylinositol glycan class Z
MCALSVFVGELSANFSSQTMADRISEDYSIWRMSRSTTSVLLFATSPVLFTFLLRPFSNSLETILLAATFLLTDIISHRGNQQLPQGLMGALGLVLALGVLTRITFVAFAAPLVAAIVILGTRAVSSESWIK